MFETYRINFAPNRTCRVEWGLKFRNPLEALQMNTGSGRNATWRGGPRNAQQWGLANPQCATLKGGHPLRELYMNKCLLPDHHCNSSSTTNHACPPGEVALERAWQILLTWHTRRPHDRIPGLYLTSSIRHKWVKTFRKEYHCIIRVCTVRIHELVLTWTHGGNTVYLAPVPSLAYK